MIWLRELMREGKVVRQIEMVGLYGEVLGREVAHDVRGQQR
jgi:hypothetical protein